MLWHRIVLAGVLVSVLQANASASTAEEERTIRAVEAVSKSVVLISASGVQYDDDSAEAHRFESTGSGFAIEPGLVVTNYHVVEYANQITVVLADYSARRASVVGTAPSFDLALLKVPFDAEELPPVDTGASTALRVGQSAFAISNPLGLQHSVSRGIVSGLGREFPGFEIGPRLIQFDAPINPGQSGGPLVNSEGQVIGVTTFKLLDVEAIGFAIPFDLVLATIPDLKSMGHPFRAELGFTGTRVSPDLASLFELPVDWGVLVERVDEGSLAERVGLRPGNRHVVLHGREYVVGGDIIVTIDDRPVRGPSDLSELSFGARPGQVITLGVARDGEFESIDVRIQAMKH